MSQFLTDPEKLSAFCQEVFLKMGCTPSDSALATDVLMQADLRGIDSHGVARLSGYIRLWKAGRIKADAVGSVVHETPGTATYDADSGLGLVMAANAMDIAIEKAKNVGSGWVAIQNSNHFGIAAYHAMKALPHDMIGMALTNASPLVSPTYSRERLLGTNPICFAIPAGEEAPVIIDLATSAAANGKLEIAQRTGKKVPSGWVQDAAGHPSTDPFALKAGGSLLPLGSNRESGSHKGYALSAFVDIFSGVLSGANYGPWVPPFVSFLPLAEDMPGKGIGHFVGAWRIDAFRSTDSFKQNMDQWIRRFRSATPTDEADRVIIPGEPEAQAEQIRHEQGIPLVEAVYNDLQHIASEFGLQFDLLKVI
ncbi:MAG: Ldh family oxidoreductase [Flavobacteriales bacterium]|nr:Ldh family oxidoreductase [Flavobacteriales bacterium]